MREKIKSFNQSSKSVAYLMTGPQARDNGFDAVRLFAAVLVIISHSFMISDGSNINEPIYKISHGQTTMGGISVGAFFIVSGLFISSSFFNSKSRFRNSR
jgi:peptidoglycan/LPS O-acetylase OafA/YrhL